MKLFLRRKGKWSIFNKWHYCEGEGEGEGQGQVKGWGGILGCVNYAMCFLVPRRRHPFIVSKVTACQAMSTLIFDFSNTLQITKAFFVV